MAAACAGGGGGAGAGLGVAGWAGRVALPRPFGLTEALKTHGSSGEAWTGGQPPHRPRICWLLQQRTRAHRQGKFRQSTAALALSPPPAHVLRRHLELAGVLLLDVGEPQHGECEVRDQDRGDVRDDALAGGSGGGAREPCWVLQTRCAEIPFGVGARSCSLQTRPPSRPAAMQTPFPTHLEDGLCRALEQHGLGRVVDARENAAKEDGDRYACARAQPHLPLQPRHCAVHHLAAEWLVEGVGVEGGGHLEGVPQHGVAGRPLRAASALDCLQGARRGPRRRGARRPRLLREATADPRPRLRSRGERAHLQQHRDDHGGLQRLAEENEKGDDRKVVLRGGRGFGAGRPRQRAVLRAVMRPPRRCR